MNVCKECGKLFDLEEAEYEFNHHFNYDLNYLTESDEGDICGSCAIDKIERQIPYY